MPRSSAANKQHLNDRSPPMSGEPVHISYMDGSMVMPHAPPFWIVAWNVSFLDVHLLFLFFISVPFSYCAYFWRQPHLTRIINILHITARVFIMLSLQAFLWISLWHPVTLVNNPDRPNDSCEYIWVSCRASWMSLVYIATPVNNPTRKYIGFERHYVAHQL